MKQFTTKDILTIPNSLKVSFEVVFVDPNNTSLSWFDSYYFEEGTFEEVYTRYISHPNAIEISPHKLRKLFEDDREDFFIQISKVLKTTKKDKYALEELADELEKEASINIGLILVDCVSPEPEEDAWVIGVNDTVMLRSPYMSVVDAIKSMTRVMTVLSKNHFFSGSNSFQVYIRNDESSMQTLNWFKIMTLYDKDHTIEYILSIPEEIRSTKTKDLLTRVPDHVIRDTLERILKKIKDTSFMFKGTQAVFAISEKEKFITDIPTSIKWASKIFVLCIVANEKEFHRDLYIEKLREILSEGKIKGKQKSS